MAVGCPGFAQLHLPLGCATPFDEDGGAAGSSGAMSAAGSSGSPGVAVEAGCAMSIKLVVELAAPTSRKVSVVAIDLLIIKSKSLCYASVNSFTIICL